MPHILKLAVMWSAF